MRGQKVIDLGFTFYYPQGSTRQEASTVTLTAPGLSKFHVHTKMQAYVMDGMFSLAKRATEIKGVAEARRAAEEDEESGKEAPEPKGTEVLDQLSIGLGVDKFPEFVEYVRRVLTNSALAKVGDTDVRLSEEVWSNIEDAGGTEAVMEVLGAFAGFFLSSPASKKANGSASPTTSASPMKEASPPTGSRMRRLQN